MGWRLAHKLFPNPERGCKALDKAYRTKYVYRYKYEILFTREKGEDTCISLNELYTTDN